MVWKRGDYNEDKTKIFSHYKSNGKEQWYTVEAWDKRKKSSKEYIKTDKSKNYQKQYYLKNKNKRYLSIKNNLEIRKEFFPLSLLFSSIKTGAKRRELVFEIDLKFILDLWKNQDGKCFHTNIEMIYVARKKNPFQVSIDRVDSSKGYTKENTVLCCQFVNYMKNDYSPDLFKEILIKLEALKLIK